MAITLATYKLESCTWYHFVRFGILHMTSFLELSEIKILKNSSKKKSVMTKTLATYKLENYTWYHFVRIGVLHMTSYSKFGILELFGIKILKNSLKK
jgi:hypothetical protein